MGRLLTLLRSKGGSTPGSLDVRVGAVVDALTVKPDGTGWNNADPIYWVGSNRFVLLRFTGLAIPVGATITSAVLTVYTNANMSAATVNDEVRVWGEDVDNSAVASSASNAATRYANNKTTASVNWYVWEANGPLTGTDQPVQSPSVASIVQEIVDRAGWASGNAITFYVEDLGTFDSSLAMRSYYNGAAGTYPRLEVAWS